MVESWFSKPTYKNSKTCLIFSAKVMISCTRQAQCQLDEYGYYFPLLSSHWMSNTTPEQIRAQLCAYHSCLETLLAQRQSQLAAILLKPQFKIWSLCEKSIKIVKTSCITRTGPNRNSVCNKMSASLRCHHHMFQGFLLCSRIWWLLTVKRSMRPP